MSLDREQIYESRQERFASSKSEPVERDRAKEMKFVADSAKLLTDAFMDVGFSMDAAIMLCGQVLPKLL